MNADISRRKTNRLNWRPYALAAAWLGVIPQISFASLADFVPFCWEPARQIESLGINVQDPEFDQDLLLATWKQNPVMRQDGTVAVHGAVYIAPIADNSGDFLLQGTKVLNDAFPAVIRDWNNGPEWAYSLAGKAIYYSAFSADETTVRIGKISDNGHGGWTVSFLPQSDGKGTPIPSKDPLDVAPKVFYGDFSGNFAGGLTLVNPGWREDSPSFHDVSMTPEDRIGRWLPDTSRMVLKHFVDVGGNNVAQGAIYSTVSQQSTIFDPRGKYRNRHQFATWRAPEIDDRIAIAATVDTKDGKGYDLVVWRERVDGSFALWTIIPTIDSQYPYVLSPEAFVLNGRSYLVLQSIGQRITNTIGPGIVWVATVDPDLSQQDQVRRVVSTEFDPRDVSLKADPEVLLINGGQTPVVYYFDRRLLEPLDGPTLPDFESAMVACETGL